jgi:branched-chain amino acid transport system permease protein
VSPHEARARYIGLALIAVALIALPLSPNPYIVTVVTLTAMSAALASCWNIVGGFAGLLSVGDAAYFGIGAYVMGLLWLKAGVSPTIGLWVGALIAMAFGLAVAVVGFKSGLRGIYFAVATLAVSEIVRMVALSIDAIGGNMGLEIPYVSAPQHLLFRSEIPAYYLMVIFLGAVLGISGWIRRSRLGYALLAVRERESAAEALGVATFRVKLTGVAISSFLIGLCGGLYALYSHYLNPTFYFSLDVVMKMILATILGGKGTVGGPLLGAVVLSGLEEGIQLVPLSNARAASLSRIVYAVLIIAVVLFMPRGLSGLGRRAHARVREVPAEPGGSREDDAVAATNAPIGRHSC